MRRAKTTKLAYTALCTAMFVVCSLIAVPSTPPFTLQTLAVFVSVGLFGTKTSLTAYAVYLALGVIGLPVFAGVNGGIHALFGPTGGFLLGFTLAIITCGALIRLCGRGHASLFVATISSLLLLYLSGALFYAFVWIGGPVPSSLKAVFLQCVVPFILPDILKLLAAVYITKALEGRIEPCLRN